MNIFIRAAAALASLSFAAISLAACGSGGGDADPATLAACNDTCEYEGMGSGCTAAAIDNCKALCTALLPGLSADCQTKAQALFTCQKTMTWSCPNGSTIAISTDQTCKAESDAFQPCQQ